jgi:hypothetical protein
MSKEDTELVEESRAAAAEILERLLSDAKFIRAYEAHPARAVAGAGMPREAVAAFLDFASAANLRGYDDGGYADPVETFNPIPIGSLSAD